MALRSARLSRRPSIRPSLLARVATIAAYLLPAVLLAGYGLAQPGLSRAAPGDGYLDGTVTTGASIAASPVNLTSNGATDWAIWGHAAGGTSTSLAPDVRKAGGSGISDLGTITGAPGPFSLRGVGQFIAGWPGLPATWPPSPAPWRFNWQDGGAVATATEAAGGLQWNGFDGVNFVPADDYGFSFTVPAGTAPQRLQVWTHAHGGTARLTATLSDLSAPVYDVSFGTGSYGEPGLHAIDFAAGAAGQTLTVTYVLDTVSPGGNGVSANPAIYAVSLAPQLVTNGGFEEETLDPLGTFTRPAGDTTVTGWTIGGDSINHVLDAFWSAFDGLQSIDLAGDAAGSVEQTLATTPGQTYRVSYAYAANPQGTGATMDVLWDGDVAATRSAVGALDPSGSGLTPAWVADSFDIVATDASTVLRFSNTAAGPGPGFGMTLDDVSVIAYTSEAVDLTEVTAPVLLRAVPVVLAGNIPGTEIGGMTPVPGTYDLEFRTSETCVDGALGAGHTAAGGFSITTTPAAPYFVGGFENAGPLDSFVSVAVAGPSDVFSLLSACIAVQPDNDSWVRALPLPLTGGATNTNGWLDSSGNARWYKFPVTPGARVTVDLSNVPADYDLFLFKDIAQAYDDLATVKDLTRVAAEFAPSAFAPSAFAPSAFAPSAFAPSAFAPSAFAPSAFAPSAFAPSAFAPSAFAPSAFAPSAFAPSAFAPSAFAPSAFAPSAFAPSAFAPSAFAPSAFAGAQSRSLISVSALPGTGDEWTVADTWNNTGNFYVRVSGKNGEFDTQDPFTLDVSISGTTCVGVANPTGPLPDGVDGDYETIILTDLDRMVEEVPGNSVADKAAMSARLETLADRADVNGVVVDVGADPRVAAMNLQADDEYECPYAKNLVAASIKDIVDAYQDENPDLRYVVIVGNDDVIPFFRYPDQSLLGPEQDYVPPVARDTTSEASLRSNMVLGQDEYGAAVTISVRGATFPVPDLAVGRLVETATEVTGMVDAYLGTTGGVVPTPTSSLVTGYDFIADAANAIETELSDGIGVPADRLVTPGHLAPEDALAWTADELRTAFLGERHDLAFLGGHFSANAAVAADNDTEVATSELLASPVNLTNSIIFSIGCHSGYNIVDPHGIDGATDRLDWPQAFARKGATLVAGTGYQYGDTDFIEYSERVYLDFARQLRTGSGPVAVGDALVRAKLAYIQVTPDIRQLHEKALLESTLFGLPMLSVDMPGERLPVPPNDSEVGALQPYTDGAGADLGLEYVDLTSNPAITGVPKSLTNLDGGPAIATKYFTGPDGVTTNPLEPALPLEVRNVTVPGKVLRGIGFLGGAYSQETLVPLTGAPNTEIRGVHVPFSSSVFFPIRPWTPNYFEALADDDGRTNLLITPVQHRSVAQGSIDAIARKFSSMTLRLFYSDNIETFGSGADASTPALAAAPSITGVTALVDGQTVTFSAKVVGNPAAGIQEVWVAYTGHANAFDDVSLVQDELDSTLWSGSITLPPAADPTDLRFMVQAVNGVGLVTTADDVGALYGVSLPGTSAPEASSLSLSGSATSGALGDRVTVKATLTSDGAVAGKTIVFSLGSTVAFAVTDNAGVATTDIDITSTASLPLTARFIGDDTTGPSSASQAFAAARGISSLTIEGPGSLTLGTSGEVEATLTSGSSSLTGKSILFKFVAPGGATRYVTRDTDMRGIATVPATEVPVGSHTVTAYFGTVLTVSGLGQLGIDDPAYAPSNVSTNYLVIWPWTGFFSPVDNLPTRNTVKAGSTVPVKFALGGNRGLSVMAAGFPRATKYSCDSGVPEDVIEETSTANTSLTYDATSGRYTYNWKTPKTYAGSCYHLELKLIDGTTHIADFKFK